MSDHSTAPGRLMAAELAEAPAAFARAVAVDATQAAAAIGAAPALYTLARGSSDAAATTLAYGAMRALGRPVTSLPPSVFSLGPGPALAGAGVLAISQSGESADLVAAARAARAGGAPVVALTNAPASTLATEASATLDIAAGPERAVPATKTVTATIGAGLALIAALAPGAIAPGAGAVLTEAAARPLLPAEQALARALPAAQHVYVIGRDTGYGAAIETALKLKECCALHAEAHSAAEVMHGPLELVTRPLLVILLDTGLAAARESLDAAEARFAAAGAPVHRLGPAALGAAALPPAAAAALLLCRLYPIIHATALALGLDPDSPSTLAKVTRTL